VNPISSKDSSETPAEKRAAPLAIPSEDFRAAGHDLVDRVADFLDGMRERPVAPGEAPTQVRAVLGSQAGLPEEGTELGPLLQETAELLFRHSTFNGHPRFFAYITGAPAPVGMLADFLASAVNPNVGAWSLSPAASEIEAQTVRWIAELIGYPVDCGGLLVSGGNAANFVAFLAARAHAGGSRIREKGVPASDGEGALRVYGSAETHTWIEKATDQYGLGTDAFRWIETDREHRMDPEALARAIERDRSEGARPMMVVGTAGSTAVGAVDPLEEIGALCREQGIWFHVDGAYGGFAAALPDASPDLKALARADSVAVDPHKWLYAPLEAGCALVRDPEALRNAFSYHPPYYHFGVEATNYVDYGPQNSRGFRALKVWLAMRQVGRSGYRRMIEDDIRLAQALHRETQRHPEIEAATCELSVVTFRYVPPELADEAERRAEDLDRLNEEILDRLERSGEAYVSNAVVGGRFYLRACIVNFRTERSDVEALPEIVARHGRSAYREMFFA